MSFYTPNQILDGYIPRYYDTVGTTLDFKYPYNPPYDYFIPNEQPSMIPLYNQNKDYFMQDSPISNQQKEMQDYFYFLNTQKGLKVKIEIPKSDINHVGIIDDVYTVCEKAGNMYHMHIDKAFDIYKNNYGDKTFKEFFDAPLISEVRIILYQLDKKRIELKLNSYGLRVMKIKTLSDNPNDVGELLK